jgi:hypothetical protein
MWTPITAGLEFSASSLLLNKFNDFNGNRGGLMAGERRQTAAIILTITGNGDYDGNE